MFDCRGERFAGIGSLSSSKSDKFCTREGEGGGDEDGAKALETVVEGARIRPVLPANVLTVGAASYVKDDAQDAANGG